MEGVEEGGGRESGDNSDSDNNSTSSDDSFSSFNPFGLNDGQIQINTYMCIYNYVCKAICISVPCAPIIAYSSYHFPRRGIKFYMSPFNYPESWDRKPKPKRRKTESSLRKGNFSIKPPPSSGGKGRGKTKTGFNSKSLKFEPGTVPVSM